MSSSSYETLSLLFSHKSNRAIPVFRRILYKLFAAFQHQLCSLIIFYCFKCFFKIIFCKIPDALFIELHAFDVGIFVFGREFLRASVNGVNWNCIFLSLYTDIIQMSERERIFSSIGSYAFTYKNLSSISFCKAFQTRCKVYVITDYSIISYILRTD